MEPPGRLPVRGRFAKLYEHINKVRDYAISLRPAPSSTTKVTHTPAGVVHETVRKKGTEGEDTNGKAPRWG